MLIVLGYTRVPAMLLEGKRRLDLNFLFLFIRVGWKIIRFHLFAKICMLTFGNRFLRELVRRLRWTGYQQILILPGAGVGESLSKLILLGFFLWH